MAEAIEDVPDGARSETARRLDRTVDVGTSVDIVLHVALVLETTQHSANSDFLEIALPRHGLVHVFDGGAGAQTAFITSCSSSLSAGR